MSGAVFSREKAANTWTEEVLEEFYALVDDLEKASGIRELPGHRLELHSIQEGVKVTLEQGLQIEKNAFVEAFFTPEAKGSMHTFFLKTMSEQPSLMMNKGFSPASLRKVGILGFGTMGRAIVIDLLIQTRIEVIVKDVIEAIGPGRTFYE
jgi:hypothetical protein